MKRFFSSPKRAILFILFIVMCIVMAIGGVMLSLNMTAAMG